MGLQVTAIDPAQRSQASVQCLHARPRFLIGFVERQPHADPASRAGLLRVRGERPGKGRAAKKREELPPGHSITSSASRRNDSGTLNPIALAALRLMTSSYLVGACTESSAGFSP